MTFAVADIAFDFFVDHQTEEIKNNPRNVIGEMVVLGLDADISNKQQILFFKIRNDAHFPSDSIPR